MEQYTPETVAAITGVPADDLHRAAEILARNRPMAVVWAMGITQHTTGVLNVLSLANLQMLLGNMGVPGGGVNPLRGQNNVQGACDMGALPNVFPGYQPVTDAAVAGQVRSRLGTGPAWPASRTGPPSLGPLRQAGPDRDGDGRGVRVGRPPRTLCHGRGPGDDRAGRQPCPGVPGGGRVPRAAGDLPVGDVGFADVLLPGASFAEKAGTFTNTERRVQLVRQAIPAAGRGPAGLGDHGRAGPAGAGARGRMPAGPQAGWDYRDPAADHGGDRRRSTPSYAGVSHARLERGDRLQWPVPDADHPGTPILHVGRFTRGLGKFHAVDHLPPAELPDADYPFLLTTGRVLYHWHGGEMSRRARGLLEAYPERWSRSAPRTRRGSG